MTAPLVLHSSPVRLALQALTPLLLTALGAYAVADGAAIGSALLLLAGLGTGAVVAVDLPLRTEFDEDGCTRVCLVRRHHLPWGQVVAIERFGGRPRRRSQDEPPPPSSTRGLAARTGPRRLHLLVDRRESHAEWDVLRALLKHRATNLRAGAPPLAAQPAGRGPRALHRRSQHPDD